MGTVFKGRAVGVTSSNYSVLDARIIGMATVTMVNNTSAAIRIVTNVGSAAAALTLGDTGGVRMDLPATNSCTYNFRCDPSRTYLKWAGGETVGTNRYEYIIDW